MTSRFLFFLEKNNHKTFAFFYPLYLASLIGLLLIGVLVAFEQQHVRQATGGLSGSVCIPAEPPVSRLGCAP